MLGFINASDALIKAIKQKPSKLGHIISTLKKEKKKNWRAIFKDAIKHHLGILHQKNKDG